MDRPSKERVDEALEYASMWDFVDSHEIVLAAEVVALREELADAQGAHRVTSVMLRSGQVERDQLREELDVERMRLAACGVAAHGAGDEHFAAMRPEYDSDALRATRQLREELEAAQGATLYHICLQLKKDKAELQELCHRTAAHMEHCNMVTREEEELVAELKNA